MIAKGFKKKRTDSKVPVSEERSWLPFGRPRPAAGVISDFRFLMG